MNGWYQALENLVWLMQLGLSMLLPLVLGLWLCSWLVNSCGAPPWLYLLFIAVGLAAGAQTFLRFGHMMQKKAEASRQKHNSFSSNRHG